MRLPPRRDGGSQDAGVVAAAGRGDAGATAFVQHPAAVAQVQAQLAAAPIGGDESSGAHGFDDALPPRRGADRVFI